ncbi:unnamed protein product, partial [Ceratitis capitata]
MTIEVYPPPTTLPPTPTHPRASYQQTRVNERIVCLVCLSASQQRQQQWQNRQNQDGVQWRSSSNFALVDGWGGGNKLGQNHFFGDALCLRQSIHVRQICQHASQDVKVPQLTVLPPPLALSIHHHNNSCLVHVVKFKFAFLISEHGKSGEGSSGLLYQTSMESDTP